MCGLQKQKRCEWRASLVLVARLLTSLLLVLAIGAPDSGAQTPAWYRLRTNSLPYQPQNVVSDSAGGLWVSAQDGDEYAPGVWYRPPGASEGPSFQYITNERRNNLLGAAYNPPIEKPQLSVSVLYAVKDKGDNTWYALKNRTVLCEKADKSWLAFNMPNSSDIQPGTDTTNVDSAFRIRLIDKPDGSQEKLLIASRGIVRVNAAFAVVETRQVYQTYNNYFIRDALVDSQGRYWVTSETGVEKGTSLVNTTFVKDLYPADPSAAAGTMITRIVEDSLGNIWFGSDSYSGDGIYRYTADGQWNKYADGLVKAFGNKVHDIVAGNNGTVWFGAVYSGNGGLLRYAPEDSGQWTHYTQADLGLQSGEVSSLAFDGTGLWFATAYNPGITGNGTGVHYLTLSAQGQPNVTHYTYRGNSTTLASLRFNYIAADLSGSVWFPSYDDPSVARLKSDGSWQQFRQAGSGSLGNFGIAGVAVDSANKVYFAPQNSPPVAYNATTEQWLSLPAAPFSDFYYYGVYVDPQDGKWFHGAFGVYYLNPANTVWTRYRKEEIPEIPDNYVDSVLMDDAGNVWFMCRYGIALMKKNPAGAPPTWFKFENGSSGFSSGYRIFQDDSGQIWNAAKQKFDTQNNVWLPVLSDTTTFDNRKLRFLNGRAPANMNVTGGLKPISDQTMLDERTMTMDTQGKLYFSVGLSSVNAGIVVYDPHVIQTLTVAANAQGTGTGSVSSNPAGISYGYKAANNGTAVFNYGATLVLTAMADVGSTVAWSDCTANGGTAGGTTAAATCTFSSLVSNKTVTAVFGKSQYAVDVTVTGTGDGTVSSSSLVVGIPSDIACTTGKCRAEYPVGSNVTLTATPNIYSIFPGWKGECDNTTGPCTVTMDSDRSVTAEFILVPKAKVGSKEFNALQTAYDDIATANNAKIKLLEGAQTGVFTAGRNIVVTLEGGYDAGYSANNGVTTLPGTMTLKLGTVTTNGITVR